jgi:hypothetical protein
VLNDNVSKFIFLPAKTAANTAKIQIPIFIFELSLSFLEVKQALLRMDGKPGLYTRV